MNIRSIITISLMTCAAASCSPSYEKYIADYSLKTISGQPDYSRLEFWAAHPDKHSTADSVPAPLRAESYKDTTADVFFIHPTTFTAIKDPQWNAPINDSALNAKTDYTTILYQASAFNEYRIFAPRYRQANLKAYFTKDTANAMAAFDLAYNDVKTAFQYYLDHYNNGRPIIIASHSQGSTHAKRLLKEFFEDKPLQKQLVVAYVIGMAIPENYFTTLQPCRDSLQTGCFVGWRSFQDGYEPGFVQEEKVRSVTVNPLIWTTAEDYAPKTLNLGAILKDFNELRPELADAQVHNGVLWIHKPHFAFSFLLRSKNYHIGDINLFYSNIRENVRTRVRSFKMTVPNHTSAQTATN